MTEISIDGDGFDALADGLRALSSRSYVLGPVGYKVVRRAVESERRLFAEAPWEPRKPSTVDRYRRPLRSMADEQLHLAMGAGPLNRHGLLERTLTVPHATGQRDEISAVGDGLLVRFGVKASGPVAYANFQPGGAGSRRPRDPFRFDRKAHLDAAADVVDHIIGQFGRS